MSTKKNEKITATAEPIAPDAMPSYDELAAERDALKAQIAAINAQLKARHKTSKDTSARDAANVKANEAAIECGLVIKENSNVANVSKYYSDSNEYVVYMRFGLKSVQVLYKDENRTPDGMRTSLIKYGLPISLIIKYDEFTENVITTIFQGKPEQSATDTASAAE